MGCELYLGKCEDVLLELAAESIDAMVTDPPAGISFMNKKWDEDKGGRDQWIDYMTVIFQRCLRILKPGSHVLVWALPRTSHWTATALENAGFEIRDSILHLFGSGFPKSLDISKAIDKKFKKGRKVIGKYQRPDGTDRNYENWERNESGTFSKNTCGFTNALKGSKITEPATRISKHWDGWGTGLKPACEHWILCRKPIGEKNIAENVLKYGTGGINVDGCRVDVDKIDKESVKSSTRGQVKGMGYVGNFGLNCNKEQIEYHNKGRFPANVVHDGSEAVLAGFPKTNGPWGKGKSRSRTKSWKQSSENRPIDNGLFQDSGSAARFFKCCPSDSVDECLFIYKAKASKRDRDEGLEGFEDSFLQRPWAQSDGRVDAGKQVSSFPSKNNHPTVKSTELMKYLCRLITPPGGTVIDPFMGSGSTGKGAVLEGFNFIGIEQENEYFDIAKARIKFVEKQRDKQGRLSF